MRRKSRGNWRDVTIMADATVPTSRRVSRAKSLASRGSSSRFLRSFLDVRLLEMEKILGHRENIKILRLLLPKLPVRPMRNAGSRRQIVARYIRRTNRFLATRRLPETTRLLLDTRHTFATEICPGTSKKTRESEITTRRNA